MSACPSENQVAEFVSGALAGDPTINAHLDHCRACLAVAAAALKAVTVPAHTRFIIIRHLGAGSMGTVYEVFDGERNAHVALKVLRHVGPDTVLRFKREFRALQNLHHPNLVRLSELVVEGDRWSFTMELLQGDRFVDYVRSAGLTTPNGLGFDEARLRDGFCQLTRGLAALHAAGKIHRDVKPSNVIVTREGRVVLLDFGLVFDQHSDDESTGGYALGTAAYMAPEQASGCRVGPEADWYAAGVMLYQSLTGHLPFTGHHVEVTAQKQRGIPTPPRLLVPAIEARWNDLCLALLQPDPAARPTANDILLELGSSAASVTVPRSMSTTTPFVGRLHELETLSHALDDSRRGQPVVVFVAGESGIGKSALVQRFADVCRDNGTVVLSGCCYEREAVPFKAVDGIVDALSRYLARLPTAEAAAILPRHAALLAHAFPVLARVKPIAEAPHTFGVRDPHELRSHLFGAFRELLARLADRQPIMLVVDDIHWADADSFTLLTELFRQPDAPALLLVATLRCSADVAENAHTPGWRSALGSDVRELRLSPMAADEAHTLATLLIARQPERPDLDLTTVVREANGHPLFINELIRQQRGDVAVAMRLDDVLWARIAHLEPAARTILQLASLSGGRLVRSVGARAAQIEIAAFESHLSLLRTVNLARAGVMSASDHLEPYHDRVRTAVLAHTSADEARRLHRQLALALEAEAEPDAEALSVHWRGAGELERSAEYAAEAAARASRTLAFDRAAELYRLALELRAAVGRMDQIVEHGLRIKLGDSLVNAGRGAEAAKVYLTAADHSVTADALDLRRRASEQLMRSGHIDEGIATLRTALKPLGVTVATTPQQALISLIVRRAQVRLRGLGYRERAPSDVPAGTLMRTDFCWSLSSTLAFVDPLLGSDLAALHLLLALNAGEPSRICRAIGSEAMYSASAGEAARAQRLLRRAHEIATRIDEPHVSGVLGVTRGMVSLLLGRFAEAHGHMEQAQRMLRADATDVAWELDVAQAFDLEMLAWMGRLDELRLRVPIAIREAESRGDRYFLTSLRVGLANNLVSLQLDDVENARVAATEALAKWSQRGFQIQHLWNLHTYTHTDLYCGDSSAARARVIGEWPRLESSLQMRVQFIRIVMHELRARCTLAVASQQAKGRPSEARALLAQAEQDIRRLRRERVAWADALAWLLQAGVAHLRADAAGTLYGLARAAESFDAADMALYAAAARQRLATLRGGRDGAMLSEQVASWFARHAVKSPARMIAMLTPAFDGRV